MWLSFFLFIQYPLPCFFPFLAALFLCLFVSNENNLPLSFHNCRRFALFFWKYYLIFFENFCLLFCCEKISNMRLSRIIFSASKPDYIRVAAEFAWYNDSVYMYVWMSLNVFDRIYSPPWKVINSKKSITSSDTKPWWTQIH